MKKNVFRAPKGKSKTDPKDVFIPTDFYYIVEAALLRLVSNNLIPRNCAGDQIFNKIRVKLNNAKNHRKKVFCLNFNHLFFSERQYSFLTQENPTHKDVVDQEGPSKSPPADVQPTNKSNLPTATSSPSPPPPPPPPPPAAARCNPPIALQRSPSPKSRPAEKKQLSASVAPVPYKGKGKGKGKGQSNGKPRDDSY